MTRDEQLVKAWEVVEAQKVMAGLIQFGCVRRPIIISQCKIANDPSCTETARMEAVETIRRMMFTEKKR